MTAVTSSPTAAKSPRNRRPTINVNGTASKPPISAAPIQGSGNGRFSPPMYVWKPPLALSLGSESTAAAYAPAAWKMMKPKFVIPAIPNCWESPRHAIASTPA